MPPVLEVQSFNHWTARKSHCLFLKSSGAKGGFYISTWLKKNLSSDILWELHLCEIQISSFIHSFIRTPALSFQYCLRHVLLHYKQQSWDITSEVLQPAESKTLSGFLFTQKRKLADSWCCHTTILGARYFVLLEKAKGKGKEESKDKWMFKTKRSGVMVRGRQSSERKRFISL